MNGINRKTAVRGLILAASLVLLGPGVASAQGGPGYLFKQPTVTLELEIGYGFQRASSDIFDFVIAEHTIGRRDFDSPYLGAEIGVRASEQVDILIGFGHQRSSTGSEFREWVDQDGLPITQVTELSQTPFTAGVKYYLTPRGRTLGRFAWVPRRVVPFVGASGGLVSYTFEQSGDFIDFDTDEIFTDTFTSNDRTFLARASGGVNLSVGDQFYVSFEGRYSWARSSMVGDFIGFDPIDLSGMQFLGGIAVRF